MQITIRQDMVVQNFNFCHKFPPKCGDFQPKIS